MSKEGSARRRARGGECRELQGSAGRRVQGGESAMSSARGEECKKLGERSKCKEGSASVHGVQVGERKCARREGEREECK